MTVRPTRACLGALVVAVVLNLLTRVTGDAWLALGSAAALVLPLASLATRPPLPALAVELTGPRSVLAGAQLVQQLVVHNPGRRPCPPVLWTDESGGLDPVTVQVPELAPGRSWTGDVVRGTARRGEYDGSTAVLSTVTPYGLLRWTRPLPAGQPLLVHPTTDRGRALRPGGNQRGEVGSRPVAGTGIEILGLRPWRPGDSSRAVSQRASARHGRPVVLEREREHEVGPGLLVLVCGGSAGPLWEQHVSHAASVALAALRDGRPVTLLSGRGGPQVARATDATSVLDFFACVDRSHDLDAADVRKAITAVHPGGTVVWLRGRSFPPEIAVKQGSTCCHHEVLDA